MWAYVFVSERKLWKLCNKLFKIILIFSWNILIWNNEPRCFFPKEIKASSETGITCVYLKANFDSWTVMRKVMPTPRPWPQSVILALLAADHLVMLFSVPPCSCIFRSFHCIHSWGCYPHIPASLLILSCSWPGHPPMDSIGSGEGRVTPGCLYCEESRMAGLIPGIGWALPSCDFPSTSPIASHAITLQREQEPMCKSWPPTCPFQVLSFDPLHALFSSHTDLSVSGLLHWLSPLPETLINSVHKGVLDVSRTALVCVNETPGNPCPNEVYTLSQDVLWLLSEPSLVFLAKEMHTFSHLRP